MSGFWIVAIVLMVLALAWIKTSATRGTAGPASYPYKKREYLLSVAERNFFNSLRIAVESDYLLFAKVRLGDLIMVSSKASNAQGYRNRIDRKHVDFLLCDPKSVSPVLVIELDDSSHQRQDRVARDNFVDAALGAAALPILHIKVQKDGYNAQAIRSQIEAAIQK